MELTKTIGGDFKGNVLWDISALWTGPKAKYFRGIKIVGAAAYPREQIARVKELGQVVGTNAGEAGGAALAGGALLGPVGLAAGLAAGRNRHVTYGIEFKDGKKIIVRVPRPNDKAFICFKNYVEENHLLDIDF